MDRQPRLRVFAGPNGSGKSIMKRQVERTVVDGREVQLGVYVNADEIAATLRGENKLDFSKYKVSGDPDNFRRFAARSGLLNGSFTRHHFRTEHRISEKLFQLVRMGHVEHFAQLLTAFICEELFKAKVKFSFETVFSHKSKLAFMERA